jgi:predicted Fe-Mo cluster-binding NifX family protein
MKLEAVSNMGAIASGGAGVHAAQTIANKSVSVLITGNPCANQTCPKCGAGMIGI